MFNAPAEKSSQSDGTHAATAPSRALAERGSKQGALSSKRWSSSWGAVKKEAMLDYITRNREDLTIAEAATKFDLSPKTAAQYLSTLAGEGRLERVSIYRLKESQ
jgi:Fic family protein